ncbi:hypothetical protein EUTSA_v10029435mg [Eutrema salsugineum]|uniref:Bifunctional inhibitor/plant lipid transfer protein/seed storage helical domain-containing protein n=1 Tax=Eutrema salsugineum TaxID=72664 RepID=V4LFM2_EUTSA|nr:non-specific lipid-transfer protein 2 [Eutrema salsugineum]ESQ38548.1 hypothetical protein EUTSA_v10029435mg [Eutrema salsugineum]
MKFATVVCIAFVIIAVSSLTPTKAVMEDEKVTCNPKELLICMPAAKTGSQPSTECCGKLKEQQSCLCGYSKDPSFSQYITSGAAKKILEACDIPIPKC